jgi:hypothetical protein
MFHALGAGLEKKCGGCWRNKLAARMWAWYAVCLLCSGLGMVSLSHKQCLLTAGSVAALVTAINTCYFIRYPTCVMLSVARICLKNV